MSKKKLTRPRKADHPPFTANDLQELATSLLNSPVGSLNEQLKAIEDNFPPEVLTKIKLQLQIANTANNLLLFCLQNRVEARAFDACRADAAKSDRVAKKKPKGTTRRRNG